MSWEKRIKHLEEAHQALNKRIDGLESTGVFDDVEINDLKKQRLRLKTQLVTLKQENNPSTHYNTEQND
jgi:hypothetical protein